MVSALVSGIVLFAVGAVIVEAVLKWLDARRWERVSHVAFRALGGGALGETQHTMIALLARDENEALTLAPRADIASFSRVGPLNARLLGSDATTKMRARAELLIVDPSWCEAAALAVAGTVGPHRDDLARWAPVMVTTDRLSTELAILSEFNDGLARTRNSLMQAVLKPSIDSRAEALECWYVTFLRTVGLRERMGRLGGIPGAIADERVWLDRMDESEAIARGGPLPRLVSTAAPNSARAAAERQRR